ncbi:MAG: SdpA family antimicrobial peptide system protein [Ekhidna sp.]
MNDTTLKGLYVTIVVGIPLVLFVYYNKANPLVIMEGTPQKLLNVFPQGWAFFTKDPQDDVLMLYSFEDGSFENAIKKSSMSLESLYGIKRHSRKANHEFFAQIIAKNIPTWTKSDNQNWRDDCRKIEPLDTITLSTKLPALANGVYLIYWSRRTPWAWSSSEPVIPCKCSKILLNRKS